MRSHTKTVSHLALVALTAAALTACASKKNTSIPTAPPMASPSSPGTSASPAMPRTNDATTSANLPASTAPIPGSVQDFLVNVGDRVYFDYDQHEVRSDAQPILDAQARWLTQYPQVSIRIEGNADERGTREYNFALGARRAESVRAYLVSRGVSAGRVETVSYGKERPIDTGASEESWARNRNGHTAITGGAR